MVKLWPFSRSVRLDNRAAHDPHADIYRARAKGRGALTGGGFRNPLSGAGGIADKGEGGFFTPTRIHLRALLETLYVESWAARKFIDVLVDDMLIRWRTFLGDDAEEMMEAEARHQVRDRLARVMKAGRLYGSAFIVIATGDAPLIEPLDSDRIRPGDLRNLIVFDRYDAAISQRDRDPFSPTYCEPLSYRFTPRSGGTLEVDASRVLRFDGIKAPSLTGWQAYDQDWGVSEIVPVLLSILQDASIASGVAHLASEASVPVIKTQDFKRALAGEPSELGVSVEEMGAEINLYRSIYRTLFMDTEDEFERVTVNFAGLADLMDRFARRLAAAADIPATRFWGQSPVGMNATGESDMRNYAVRVAAMQESMLRAPLSVLDAVLARDAGLTEPSEYEFMSLLDLSDDEKAATAKTRAEAVNLAVQAGLIDENEGRAALSGDPVFGELDDLA